MANREDIDIDDDFSDLYKEYTGPPRCTTTSAPETAKTSKRSHAGSDEEEEQVDPNAVPTGFISREAKVWVAKSKATERNWKKRKEEEMICKICGDSGHFTQGCPSTLGASRKSQEVFERVPARDPAVKALFSERVIRNIEKEIGCKIKVEEKFIIVSGKDGQILSKGVDAVHRIKNEGAGGESNFNMEKSRSPPKGRSPVPSSRMVRPDSQRASVPSPSPTPRNHHPSHRPAPARQQDNDHKYPPQAARAYGSRSTHSRSPARPQPPPPYAGGSALDDNNRGVHRNEVRDEKRGPDMHKGGGGYSISAFSQTLEELELEYKRDAMAIANIRDKEEDEENYRHRQVVREMREDHMKRLGMLREMHTKQWEEFLQVDSRRRRQMPSSGFSSGSGSSYKHHNSYYEYGNAAANPYTPAEGSTRVRYPEIDNYANPPPHPSLRSNNTYDQRQRHDDYGEPYNRY